MSQTRIASTAATLLREVYYSVYMVFFSLFADQWSPDMNAVKGAVGVSIIEYLLLISVVAWIQVIARSHVQLNRWLVGGISLAIFAANIYALNSRKRGIIFEQEFKQFRPAKKMVLYSAAVAVIIATVLLFAISASIYRQTWVAR